MDFQLNFIHFCAFIEEDFSPPPPPPQSAAKKQRRPPPPPPPQRIEKIKIRAKFDETKQENFIDPNGLNCKLYFIAQSLALIILIIMLTWLIRYFNGFNLIGHHIIDEKHIDRFINFHPLVMTFTMVFVMANSILFINSSNKLTTARSILSITIFSLDIIGLMITIYWHMNVKLPHLQSLHSWLGILTLIMLIFYFCYILYVYDNQDITEQQRLDLVFTVRLFGLATLIIAGTTCLIGLNQIISMKIPLTTTTTTTSNSTSVTTKKQPPRYAIEKNYTTYFKEETYRSETILIANIMAILIIVYITIMMYMIIKFRQKPLTGNIFRQQMERQLRETIEHTMFTIDEQKDFNDGSYNHDYDLSDSRLSSPPPIPIPMKNNKNKKKIIINIKKI
ncbi:hypothetical protein DERP_003469 [Dermatophagoides pteronyssinus]|uniref:Cytochrome b561 domain-containing protein n=1 Tax=Dermatophagoides pteronyssinus TaxID=6956 RepID=A0ABQ8JL87_DERPT|nr:hypothetical protein DERP_003469 [Dermatophagoides pteronyssinus]